jgi:hypothetical protein
VGRPPKTIYRDTLNEAERRLFDRAAPGKDEPPSPADGELQLMRVLVGRLLERQEPRAKPEEIGRMVALVDRLLRTRQTLLGDAPDPMAGLSDMLEKARLFQEAAAKEETR